MSTVVVDIAGPADDARIRELVRREVMPGRVRLSMAREPYFSLGCAATGDDCRVVVARSATDGAIVGVACRSTRRVFLNGRETRIGYLGQLRLDHGYRGRWLVSRGFARLAEIHREDPVPAYLMSIVDGNEEATGVLIRGRRQSFPPFREAARYCTLALPTWWARRTPRGPEEILAATPDQVPELVCFLRREGARRHFFSAWTEQDIRALPELGLRLDDIHIARRAGTIVGVIALWDQTAYKQLVVRGYSGWLRVAAAISSRGGRWLPRPIVPGVGEALRSVYASLVCLANDDAGVFGRLLRLAYTVARTRRFHYLVIGMDARDPLLDTARAYPHISYPSRLYLARWPDDPHTEPPHEPFDNRLSYVDVATL
jgi:hypothetical protein